MTLACGAGADDAPPAPAPAAPAPTAAAQEPPPVPLPTPVVAPVAVAPVADGAVVFDGTTYRLASSEGPLREYLPVGEVFESFTAMIAVRHQAGTDPLAAATRFADTLRAQTPPTAFNLSRDDRGRAMIDFVATAGPITEFNIFIFQPNPTGGLISQQIVRRNYTDGAALRQSLQTERARLLRAAAAFAFPTFL